VAYIKDINVKKLLQEHKIPVPQGGLANTADDAAKIFKRLNRSGLVRPLSSEIGRFPQPVPVTTAAETVEAVQKAFEMQELEGKVEVVSIEEDLTREREFVLGFSIDQAFTQPLMYFSTDRSLVAKWGWSKERDGISLMAVDVQRGVRDFQSRNLVRRCKIDPDLANKLTPVMQRFYQLCRRNDIIRGEISPLVYTSDGRLVAVSCELIIDDDALFRNMSLKDELHHDQIFSPTRAAVDLEKMIYVLQDLTPEWGELVPWVQTRDIPEGLFPVILLAQDDVLVARFLKEALARESISVSHLCLLKGNVSASKVLRVFQLFLSTGIAKGFFISGLGFSTLDQSVLARGLMKAFRSNNISIPGVVRFDSFNEQIAIETIRDNCWDLPAVIEPYGKDNSIIFCIKRLRVILEENKIRKITVDALGNRETPEKPYRIDTLTGSITIDHNKCISCQDKICLARCPVNILKEEKSVPVLAIERDNASSGGCIECLACEFFCWTKANNAISIDLPALSSKRK